MNQEQAGSKTLFALLTIAVAIYLIEKLGQAMFALSNVLLVLALAWLLAFALRPLVHWIHRLSAPAGIIKQVKTRLGDRWAEPLLHPPYGFAIFVVYVLLIAGLVVIMLALIPAIIDQIQQLTETLRHQDLIQRTTEFINSAREFLKTRLLINPDVIALPTPQELVNQIIGFGSSLVQFTLSVVGAIAATLGQIMLIIFISVLVMIDGDRLVTSLMRLIPRRRQSDVQFAISTIERTFGGFLRGTVLQGLIYGIGVMVLMTILGIGSGVATGAATGILMLIPIIGGPIGLIIPLLVGLLQASVNTWWLIGLLIVFQVVLFNFVMPRLLSKSLRMPALLVIAALLTGAQLMGIWGFVFAVPVAAALYSIGLVLLEQSKRRQDHRDDLEEKQDAAD